VRSHAGLVPVDFPFEADHGPENSGDEHAGRYVDLELQIGGHAISFRRRAGLPGCQSGFTAQEAIGG
jgi:hypothetical protein